MSNLISCVFLLLNFLLKVSSHFVPQWPDNYYVKARLTVPEANFVQTYQIWYSKEHKKSRVDIDNGLATSYQQIDGDNDLMGTEYTIFRLTNGENKTLDCIKAIGTAESPIDLQPGIYPIEDMFEYNGTVDHQGVKLYKFTRGEDPIGQTFRLRFTFLMYCDIKSSWFKIIYDCIPVRLEMEGRNLLFTSHVSNYYFDYISFQKDAVTEKKLMVDFPVCRNYRSLYNETLRKTKVGTRPLSDFLPSLSTLAREDRGFGDFIRKHGDRFKSKEEFRKQLRHFKREAARKKLKKNYKMKLRKFLDLSKVNMAKYNNRLRIRPESRKQNRRKLEVIKKIPHFKYSNSDVEMLKNYSYYNLNEEVAMNPVQSQLTCGSCWAFATAAVLEGTYFVKYGGPRIKVSEQAMIDCSWGHGNLGCFGGRENFAIEWVKEYNGVPLSRHYGEYKAASDWCDKSRNETELVRVKKYERIRVGDYKAIQIALIKNGPVLTAMDASHESMKKYTKGLYREPNCSTEPNHLDHTVAIVGFDYRGNELYWIVRNSWSSNWGFSGHILVPANNNVCGLSTSALVVYVE